MSLEGLELDPLAVRQVVVKRRGGIGADRVEDRHALIGVVVGQARAFGRAEGDHLVDDPAVHRARFRQRAEHARRAAREPGHPGLGHQVHVLLPEGAHDPVRDLGGDLRASARRQKGARPLRLRPVHLAQEDTAEQHVGDDAGRLDRGEHLGDPAEHVARAEDAGELVLVVDAVLDREHARAGPDHRTDRLRGALRVERLHAEEHEIGGGKPVQPLDRRHLHHRFALDGGLDPKPVLSHRREMRAAGHERHVLPRPRQLRPEIPPCPSRPHHDDPHVLSSRTTALPPVAALEIVDERSGDEGHEAERARVPPA